VLIVTMITLSPGARIILEAFRLKVQRPST
jgi:hypothetical protein